jgi:hypothetical protein|tara:strand:- start:324 stop:542 length:219 start_codon:yes stop_codon:yes gene_type:complete
VHLSQGDKMEKHSPLMHHPLIEYALNYIGEDELYTYCENVNTNQIDINSLRKHLIGKVGCSELEVNYIYKGN